MGCLIGLTLRIALSDECELIGANHGQLGRFIQLAQIELVEESEQPVAVLRRAYAGQSHSTLDRSPRTGLGEDSVGPFGHRTTLDRHAGGEPDEAVLMSKGLPRLSHSLGARAFQMELFEFAAELGRGTQFRSRGRSGAVLAHISHPIDGRLGATAANGEVHRAILGMDHHIGQRQRTATNEFLLHSLVARALRSEVDGVHGAVGPVVGENSVLVARRELGSLTGGHTGGRARADVDERREAVGIVGGPLAGTGTPTHVAATSGH